MIAAPVTLFRRERGVIRVMTTDPTTGAPQTGTIRRTPSGPVVTWDGPAPDAALTAAALAAFLSWNG